MEGCHGQGLQHPKPCISRTSDQSVLPGQLVALPWEQEDREGGREGVIWVSCESTAHAWSSRSWEGRLSLLWGLGIHHTVGQLRDQRPRHGAARGWGAQP